MSENTRNFRFGLNTTPCTCRCMCMCIQPACVTEARETLR